MKVVFVHGWSVTDTSTYGRLPEALAAQAARHGIEVAIEHVWLGKYISFHDEVTMSDVTRAFDRALRDTIPDGDGIAEFSCITHSTGGPVVREWLQRSYGAARLADSPLRHLVMLAPANHGSALAALGKQRVGRIQAWWNGVEPGQRILDWLALGSQEQRDLCAAFLEYEPAASGFYPFVLTGQDVDRKFYDFINSYLTELGSDGVVRVAAANLNYTMVRLVEGRSQATVGHVGSDVDVQLLELDGKPRRPQAVGLGVVPDTSHSGVRMGVMAAVDSPDSGRAQVAEILKCLAVTSRTAYSRRVRELAELTDRTQSDRRGKRGHRFVMLVFAVRDDQGDAVTDFDLFLLGGDGHAPDKLSKGFFVDRQQNARRRNHLVYYVDYDVITKNGLTGFRVVARPSEGEFGFYRPVEYRAAALTDILQPNETLYVEIVLRRRVDRNVFRFDEAKSPQLRKEGLIFKDLTRRSFKDVDPSGEEVD